MVGVLSYTKCFLYYNVRLSNQNATLFRNIIHAYAWGNQCKNFDRHVAQS
jgi:hypothetical protein